ncbi:hypothetical protein EKN56_15850 [Limnobaculum zhutongyuii]|uniref:Uncharacterized protein n=1 Tax=Limnobaculum zhutongyuii TaxID=2498113 RepID=A0A411WNK6_9GAMM|nr:hypothetical protein [Limnobaculum zhutongyuii]QBH97746.1 hypothetical protein EKN56_15850 [Limnobaculum zhutongyuii]TQS87963.1 hypothetical protein ELQ32_12990 [Limnobaculum zhutongyuii]
MHSFKVNIATSDNTKAPCFSALKAKGYEVKITLFILEEKDNARYYMYEAIKKGQLFTADSPEELLGLITMWETRGDVWRITKDEAREYDEIEEQATIYDSTR